MGSKDASEAKVELTQGQLQDLISGAVVAALKGIRELDKPPTLAEQAQAAKDLPALDVTEIHDFSSTTGATMTLRVTHGIVSQIPNYKLPPEAEIPASEGGLVPNGLPIRTKEGAFTEPFKQWRYETFWCADLRQLVGKPVPHYVKPTASAKAA